MGKLNKQSSGVGKYLKYHNETVTGGNLPNVIQQTNGGEDAQICPDCGEYIGRWYHKGTEYRNCGCVEW
jgi:hypothetical protein